MKNKPSKPLIFGNKCPVAISHKIQGAIYSPVFDQKLSNLHTKASKQRVIPGNFDRLRFRKQCDGLNYEKYRLPCCHSMCFCPVGSRAFFSNETVETSHVKREQTRKNRDNLGNIDQLNANGHIHNGHILLLAKPQHFAVFTYYISVMRNMNV